MMWVIFQRGGGMLGNGFLSRWRDRVMWRSGGWDYLVRVGDFLFDTPSLKFFATPILRSRFECLSQHF